MSDISKTIDSLNRATIRAMAQEDVSVIMKNFTEECIKIFNADFGFAWGRFGGSESRLVYKSADTPYVPTLPVKKGPFVKSFLIIPISYIHHTYGNIVLCYKKPRKFNEEETSFSETVGNIVSQALTISWQIQNEENSLALAKKQRETEVLLAQEKSKTEFIANATHELRTPLAIMKGNVDLALLSKNDTKLMRAALNEVNTEIKILAEILRDLALLTSSNKGLQHILNKTKVELFGLIEGIAKRVRTLSREKKITIKVSGGKKKFFVFGDKNYLEKLFLNLMKNAVTYGKVNGKIYIKISKDKNKAKIEIIDDGIGISEEDLPKIFERFYRADKAHTGHGNHSGLGLPISKWVAETHGGHISVKSEYGKGSTFIVTLPLAN